MTTVIADLSATPTASEHSAALVSDGVSVLVVAILGLFMSERACAVPVLASGAGPYSCLREGFTSVAKLVSPNLFAQTCACGSADAPRIEMGCAA